MVLRARGSYITPVWCVGGLLALGLMLLMMISEEVVSGMGGLVSPLDPKLIPLLGKNCIEMIWRGDTVDT